MRARLRGFRAVVRLASSAVDHYVTARIGLPPVAWCARQVAAVIRHAYQLGRFGPPSTRTDLELKVYEVEVLHEENC